MQYNDVYFRHNGPYQQEKATILRYTETLNTHKHTIVNLPCTTAAYTDKHINYIKLIDKQRQQLKY